MTIISLGPWERDEMELYIPYPQGAYFAIKGGKCLPIILNVTYLLDLEHSVFGTVSGI